MFIGGFDDTYPQLPAELRTLAVPLPGVQVGGLMPSPVA
jgi:hypothetical protein